MRCLIIDDDERWQNGLEDELTFLGFKCTFAKNDIDAIREIKNAEQLGDPFRLITLDRQLEGIGVSAGVRILSFLKSYLHSKQGQTVCVVISGTSSDIDVRDYFKQYLVHDFIPKSDPKIWDKLKQIVNSITEAVQETTEIYEERLNTLKRTLREYYRNLSIYEERAAQYGINIPIDIINQIDFYKRKIQEIQSEIEDLMLE